MPGIAAERLTALFPSVVAELTKMMPLEPDSLDSAKSVTKDKQAAK
jgi:hypothetical protein